MEEEWTVIMKASGMVNANIIAGRLEAEEIPVKFEYEAIGAIYGLTVDGLGEVKIMVPKRYTALAHDILARYYDEADIEWKDS